ncbi:MAG: hypothetical protein K5880_14810 [Hydrogenophaga sp.]|uniref:hypothetical protein n=1 Tax=Hydrogenophaga sp. TaxID=1904254 RepID=UPI0026025C5D|nr:hypothetical protein [Hydrogenophaga sp.]MCV0439868.1 hypothetical protein [Hydrogenophaga sp.]
MKATDEKAIFRQLESDLMRAEAVVQAASGSRKLHEPTVDIHRGQAIALKKALYLLETNPPRPIEIIKDHTVTVSWRVFFLIVTVAAIIL